MVSPELIRRFPFFAGLESSEIDDLAKLGEAFDAVEGKKLFQEGEDLECLFLVESGEVGIIIEATAQDFKHGVAAQLTGTVKMEDVVVSSAKDGDVFGWSALIPPYQATAGVKVLSSKATIVSIDAIGLRKIFEEKPQFGYKMALKIAQVSRQRLQDSRIESLASKG